MPSACSPCIPFHVCLLFHHSILPSSCIFPMSSLHLCLFFTPYTSSKNIYKKTRTFNKTFTIFPGTSYKTRFGCALWAGGEGGGRKAGQWVGGWVVNFDTPRLTLSASTSSCHSCLPVPPLHACLLPCLLLLTLLVPSCPYLSSLIPACTFCTSLSACMPFVLLLPLSSFLCLLHCTLPFLLFFFLPSSFALHVSVGSMSHCFWHLSVCLSLISPHLSLILVGICGHSLLLVFVTIVLPIKFPSVWADWGGIPKLLVHFCDIQW